MSAHHDDDTGPIYVPEKNRDEFTMAIIAADFDARVDNYNMFLYQKEKAEAHLRKNAVIRVFSYPLDLAVGLFMFGPLYLVKRSRLQISLIRFVFKKIKAIDMIKSAEECG